MKFTKMWTVFVMLSSILQVIAETPVSIISDLETPPFINFSQSRQLLIYRVGDNITLPCQALGNPKPIIQWYSTSTTALSTAAQFIEKSDSTLSLLAASMTLLDFEDRLSRYVKDIESGSLYVLKAELGDAGLFQCVASNIFGATVSNLYQVAFVENAQFLFDSVTTLEAAVGDSAVLRCRYPYSFPTPVRYWSVFDDTNPLVTRAVSSGSDKQNNRNPRITMDFEGNLYFTNVQEEDYNVGAERYVSNQYQKDIRSSYHGCDHVLKQTQNAGTTQRDSTSGTSRVYPGVSTVLLYTSPDTVIVEENNPVRMKCIFGGYPTPVVEWYRQFADGSSRKLTEAQEFSLANALEADTGVYFCVPKGSASLKHSFSVQVVYAPRFVAPLRNTIVNEDESVDLRCDAVAKPAAVTFEWFFNGQRITPFSDLRRWQFIDSNNVRFLNMSRNTIGTVHCNASNSVGYALSEAAIIVTNRAPIIVQPLTDAVYVATTNVTLTCDSFSPAVTISWYKDGRIVDDSFERMNFDGPSLTLLDVTKADSGIYKCVLTNKFGQTENIARLTIKQRTAVAISPTELSRRETEDARFVCTFSVDSSESNAQVEWMKGDRIIPSDSRFSVIRDGFKSILLIARTVLTDTDEYKCVVRTSADVGSANANLYTQAQPNAPVRVTMHCSAITKEARITWQSGGHNNAEITNYMVEYATPQTSSWQRMQNVTAKPGNAQSTVLRLAGWMNYTFRVIAQNSIGLSQPSEPTPDVCATPAEKPVRNPEGVVVHGVQDGSITITWSALEISDVGGPEFVYRVRVICDTEGEFPRAALVADVNVTDYWRNSVTLTELAFQNGSTARVPTYRRCRAMVVSFNVLGDSGTAPRWYDGYSGEGGPLVVPQAVEVDSTFVTEPNTIAVVIRPPRNVSVDAIRGCWTGYQIAWWDSRVPPFTKHRSVNVSLGTCHDSLSDSAQRQPVTAILSRVPGRTNITIVAALTTRYYIGPWSSEVIVTTPDGVPNKCEDFSTDTIGATFVRLKWIKPTVANGHILGYKLGYSLKDASGRWSTIHNASTINDPEMWGGSLFGLTPNTSYKLYVWAFTARGEGEKAWIETKTLEAPSRSSKVVFFVTIINETTVNVTFNSSASDVYVQYRPKGKTLWQLTSVDPGKRWKVITGLNRQWQYEFRAHRVSTTQDDIGSEIVMVTMILSDKNPFSLGSVAWLAGLALLIIVLLIILTVICFRKKKSRLEMENKLTPLINVNPMPLNGHLGETYQETQLTQLLNEADCHSIPSPYHNNNSLTISNCNQVRDNYSNSSSYETNSSGFCNSLRPPSRQATPKRPVDNFRMGAVSFSKLSGIECDV